jgi:hypothetical protein
MRWLLTSAFLLAAALQATAAERILKFGDFPENQPPPGFRSVVTGVGKPGDWKVIMDEVPSILPPLSPNAAVSAHQGVLAQLSQDPADEHFPLLILDSETYRDFSLRTRFKTVRGAIEEMAGVAFRIQDENNYYVVRASSRGNTFRFYKVVKGERGPPIGLEVPIPAGVWHEMGIECKGNEIRCTLNGKEVIPTLHDSSFTSGKIGFWTKSDSVSYFGETHIIYTPLEAPAQAIVAEMLKKYPRLLGMDIYVASKTGEMPALVGSKDPGQASKTGGQAEQDTLHRGTVYYGKDKEKTVITMPVRDRNGDPVAAVKLVLKSFPGQTEQNALGRARPIVKDIQSRVESLDDLTN